MTSLGLACPRGARGARWAGATPVINLITNSCETTLRLMHIHAASPPAAVGAGRGGATLATCLPCHTSTGTEHGAGGRGHGDAAPSIYSGSVQVGHSFALVNTFMLLLSTSAPGAGYVPVPQVPPVPHPACCCFSLVLCLRLVQLACCLSCWQLCSFNNLLGTLSRRTGQAAWFWSGEGR